MRSDAFFLRGSMRLLALAALIAIPFGCCCIYFIGAPKLLEPFKRLESRGEKMAEVLNSSRIEQDSK